MKEYNLQQKQNVLNLKKLSPSQLKSLCKFSKPAIVEIAADINKSFEHVCIYLMFWCTKMSMRKMTALINKKLTAISKAVKNVRNALFINKSKDYFSKVINQHFIKQNTTNHSRNMLNILNKYAIIVVVDGTIIQTQKPSKCNFFFTKFVQNKRH